VIEERKKKERRKRKKNGKKNGWMGKHEKKKRTKTKMIPIPNLVLFLVYVVFNLPTLN